MTYRQELLASTNMTRVEPRDRTLRGKIVRAWHSMWFKAWGN